MTDFARGWLADQVLEESVHLLGVRERDFADEVGQRVDKARDVLHPEKAPGRL